MSEIVSRQYQLASRMVMGTPMNREVVIVSAARTAIGRFQGGLKSLTAPQLGAAALAAAINRAGIDLSVPDEVIMGCVLQAGLGQNPARQAALAGGLPETIPAVTVNMVCGSGLKSVMLAAQAIGQGDAQWVVAGGMESMSNAPYLLPGARDGYRLGNSQLVDALVHDGLWCAFDRWHMGETGEVVAGKFGISRESQDRYALESHRRAVEAVAAGRFASEIVPVTIPQRKGPAIIFNLDEGPRTDASLDSLSSLSPAFRKGGTVTAGNASTINDGAAALVIASADAARARQCQPLARIVAQAASGVEPKMVMMAPVDAVREVARRAGWRLADVDLIELNEAFSSQSVALLRELDLDPDRVNVNGGAVALGHPIGASGARILVTLLHEMARRNARRGIASLCLGGGNAVALAVERQAV